MTRTGAAAISFARNTTSWHPIGMCLVFTRSCFEVPARYGSARLAWENARKKHSTTNPNNIPAGVPVFWLGGSHGYGHIAFSLGNGLVRSSDWPHAYNVGTARITDISRTWGQRFVGWTEDLNGVTVYKGGSASAPADLDLSAIVAAVKSSGKVRNGIKLKKAVAAEVGKGNLQFNHSTLGEGFKTQYKLVQREYLKSVGATPRPGDVDGIPGSSSLKWLAHRHGLTVQD